MGYSDISAGTDIISETTQGVMGMIGTIFSIIVFAFIFIIALQGLRRGLNRQLLHTGFVILSAVIAFFICKGTWANVLSMFEGQTTADMIASIEASSGTAIAENTRELLCYLSPELFAYILALPYGVVLFPFIFVGEFLIVNFVLWIVYLIVRISLKLDRGQGMTNKLTAFTIALIEGIIVTVIIFTPFANVADIAGEVITVAEEDGGLEIEVDGESLEPALNNGGFKFVRALGGKAIAKSFTTLKIDGEKVNIREDAIILLKTVFVEFKNLEGINWNKLTADDKASLNSIVDSVVGSDYFSSIIALAFNGLGTALKENPDLMPVEPPIDQFMPIAFEMIASSTKDTLRTDIDTVLSVYYILSDSEVLTATESGSDPVELLTKKDAAGETVINKVINTLKSNSRTSALVTALTKYSLSLLASNLDIGADATEIYEDVKATINEDILSIDTDIYDTDEKRIGALTKNLDTALKEHSIELELEIVEDIAEYIDTEFISNGITEVDDEQFNDIILSYYDYYVQYMNTQGSDAK